MFEKLFKKSEVWFAVLFILIYVIGNSMLDQVSNDMGYEMLLSIPFDILLLIVLFTFIKKNNLFEYYGLCKVKADSRKVLFYIPLIIISTVNVWFGFDMKMALLNAIIYFVAMLVVGVTEEMLFRGLLFKAMKKNLKAAIIVTSLTFGLGHIVNLFNDSGMDRLETICQLFYAVAIGFLLVAVLYATKSIIPCMITHSIFNALSTFANEVAFESVQIPVSIALCLISGVSAIVIFAINRQNMKVESC